MYVYMLAIAGQMAGPNWLTFFEGILGVTKAKKILFHRQRRALQLVFSILRQQDERFSIFK